MTPGRSRDEIVAYLRAAVAAELRRPVDGIDSARPLTFYGLDSLAAATIAGELSDWLGHDLPDDLVLARATVSSLADRLADPATAVAAQTAGTPRRASDRIDYAALDYGRPPRGERLLKALVGVIVRVISRVSIDGADTAPLDGPVIFATNHLHILDALWMAYALPRRTIFLVAEEFERKPLVGWLLNAGRAIYISRRKADKDALDRALVVLKNRGALGVAPEGRLSRTGGLIRGQNGIAFLASRAGVPVVPVAMWGQERAGRSWLRLQRVRVQIRFGPAVVLPAGLTKAEELERGVELIMRSLARLLPPAYQGDYREPSAAG